MKNNENIQVLQDYGVTLHRLTHDKIEMLRCWRNDPKIQQYMFYRDYITPQMQETWFAKTNNRHNFYFIIEFDGKEIGLINVKDVDYEKLTGESGVFIYDDKYLNSDVAYRAHLVMFDFIYGTLGLKSTYSHIIGDNLRALRFMYFLGGKAQSEEPQNTAYILYTDDYFNNLNRQHFIKRWNHFNKKQ